MSDFSLKFKDLVYEKKWSKTALAVAIGVKSVSTITNWMTGKTSPYALQIEKICQTLKVPNDYFFPKKKDAKEPIDNSDNNNYTKKDLEIAGLTKVNEFMRERLDKYDSQIKTVLNENIKALAKCSEQAEHEKNMAATADNSNRKRQ